MIKHVITDSDLDHRVNVYDSSSFELTAKFRIVLEQTEPINEKNFVFISPFKTFQRNFQATLISTFILSFEKWHLLTSYYLYFSFDDAIVFIFRFRLILLVFSPQSLRCCPLRMPSLCPNSRSSSEPLQDQSQAEGLMGTALQIVEKKVRNLEKRKVGYFTCYLNCGCLYCFSRFFRHLR